MRVKYTKNIGAGKYVQNIGAQKKLGVLQCWRSKKKKAETLKNCLTVRLQRSSVVSALGCCTAAPGSNPARHPTLGPAG
jgi:hypothetical protein